MKATRLVGWTLPAVLATALVVLPASPAAAAAKKLVLSSEGTAVANGSTAAIGFEVANCGLFSNGTVVTNSSPKDIVKGDSSSNEECPHAGEKISGLITEVQLKSSGSAKFKGSVTISRPGGCSYTFKGPKGTFEAPGFLLLEGTITGKLAKGSSKTCVKTLGPVSWHSNITNTPFGEPFKTSLS